MLKVFRFDASGCNGCDIEILSAVLVKDYGVTGVEVVDAPEKAGAMIVTGGGNDKTAELLKSAHSKLQEPKLVIAMGACAASMCVFKPGYPMRGPVDTVIPVSYFVIGCPPRPQNLAMAIHALQKSDRAHEGPVWLAPDGLRSRMSLDGSKCTACGACANMCPSGAIDISREGPSHKVAFNMWKCSFCGSCQHVCPEKAVTLTGNYALHGAEKAALSEAKSIESARCVACGAEHLTRNQVSAVRARILENMPGADAGKASASLSLCPACKARPGRQRAARADTASWAISVR